MRRNERRILGGIIVGLVMITAYAQETPCTTPTIGLSPDYTYLTAFSPSENTSLHADSPYRWRQNGVVVAEGMLGEGLLLNFDNTVDDTHGVAPLSATGIAFTPGKFGEALALSSGGKLSYPIEGGFNPAEGTLEMWVALRQDGADPLYAARSHTLFHYRTSDNDYLVVSQSSKTGILYFGGETNGEWQSAYGESGNTRAWPAGEWHLFSCTWSASGNFMRCYLDGVLVADTNEDQYVPPASGGTAVYVGGDMWGNTAAYRLDEVRVSTIAYTSAEIAARAHANRPGKLFEVWRSTADLAPGDVVTIEYAADSSHEGCVSDPLIYPGIPLTDPEPPSTLLPAGSTELSLSVNTIATADCRYAVNTPADYAAMTPFDSGGGLQHHTSIRGIDPDPNRVNDVYIRCSTYPDYLLHLQYRCISEVNPSFPRTGNLWGWWDFVDKGLDYCARIDLWLGADFNASQVRTLRRLNPAIRILTSINAVENDDVPADYFLKDIHGERIEVWPGSYRLNLTRPEVAEYQARYAYQRLLDGGLMQDGCFFDNVMTTQSWQRTDIYGNPFLVDADEDGVQDDKEAFDAAWKAGVFHEIETFRKYMPYAVVSGHSMDIDEPGIGDLFNGLSIGFATADVIEGKRDFDDLFAMYAAWHTHAVSPFATMVESSPPDQIAYGYDYSPLEKIPASTLDFAEHYYPYVRFGLTLTLMQDGFFAHEFGDTWHGNDWWYDELDTDLGYPLGPAERVPLSEVSAPNRLLNSSFDDSFAENWRLWADSSEGYTAQLTQDTPGADGAGHAARIQIQSTEGVTWRVNCYQEDRTLEEGVAYEVCFRARADKDRSIDVSAQKGSDDWRGYGLDRTVAISTEWADYRVTFTATENATDARVQFFLGAETGTVWLDDAVLRVAPPPVYRRYFDNGLVLINGSKEARTIPIEKGYKHFQGEQAARYEYIVDDSAEGFVLTGDWEAMTLDSGEWKASGPFYHDWGSGCRKSIAAGATAEWPLAIAEEDTYTLRVWWPAYPDAGQWSSHARFEIIAHEAVVASAELDQRSGGDEWHTIAAVTLRPTDNARVRLISSDAVPCIADAIHVTSARRYNDGAPVSSITLQSMDGVLLVRNSDPGREGESVEGEDGEGESEGEGEGEGEGEDEENLPGCCRRTTSEKTPISYTADAAVGVFSLLLLAGAGRKRHR